MDTSQNKLSSESDEHPPGHDTTSSTLFNKEQESADKEQDPLNVIPAPALQSIDPANNAIMEVHHHGHVHEQKKWKEYLFQFVMLFLAVFLGFLAEYKLEQVIERHREKEYIESLINDIKSDTAQIRFRSSDITNAKKGIDSLLFIAKDLEPIENARLFCYYYVNYVPMSNILVANDGTMQQLKNAGGLRLIRNKKAVDSILSYDSYSRSTAGQAERYKDNVIKALDATDFIFDWSGFDGRDPKTLLTSNPTPLLHPTQEQMQYFINRLLKQKGTSVIYQRYLEDQFQRASRLLVLLQKEYKM
jgi:hypothetical protein